MIERFVFQLLYIFVFKNVASIRPDFFGCILVVVNFVYGLFFVGIDCYLGRNEHFSVIVCSGSDFRVYNPNVKLIGEYKDEGNINLNT